MPDTEGGVRADFVFKFKTMKSHESILRSGKVCTGRWGKSRRNMATLVLGCRRLEGAGVHDALVVFHP